MFWMTLKETRRGIGKNLYTNHDDQSHWVPGPKKFNED